MELNRLVLNVGADAGTLEVNADGGPNPVELDANSDGDELDVNGDEVVPNSEGVDAVEVKRLGDEPSIGPKPVLLKTGGFGANRLEVVLENRLEDD